MNIKEAAKSLRERIKSAGVEADVIIEDDCLVVCADHMLRLPTTVDTFLVVGRVR